MNHVPSLETLALVNELLRTTTPAGAWCVGSVCGLVWREGHNPSPAALESAARMERFEDAMDFLALLNTVMRARA